MRPSASQGEMAKTTYDTKADTRGKGSRELGLGISGMVAILVGGLMHRGGTGLAFQSERFGLAIALAGLGLIGLARILQEHQR